MKVYKIFNRVRVGRVAVGRPYIALRVKANSRAEAKRKAYKMQNYGFTSKQGVGLKFHKIK